MFLAFIFSVATAFGTGDSPEKAAPVPVSQPLTVNKSILLGLVNQARKNGYQCGDKYYPAAPPVRWNDLLEVAAIKHSMDMEDKRYFSHTSKNGTNPGNRIDREGYKWKCFGENIAMGYNNEKEVVDGWLKSPGHCKNIMNKDFKEMGVARSGKYWTQTLAAKL